MLRHAPQFYARIGGVLYLLIIAAGLFAEALVRNRLVVPGDAAATARNITDHLQLLGGAAYLNVFSREQLEAMALLSVNTHSVGFAVALMFFGCSCVPWAISPLPLASFPRPSAC